MMSGIRGANTSPELALRRALHRAGLRFRLHARGLPGRPDILLPRHRVAIFVHGCFWHRHDSCHWCSTPANNATFWEEKFARNVTRDREAVDALARLGWRTAIVWECGLRKAFAEKTVAELVAWIRSDETSFDSGLVRKRAAPATDQAGGGMHQPPPAIR